MDNYTNKRILRIILESSGNKISNPVERNTILQNSGLNENEFNLVINYLISNEWISKFAFDRINMGDVDVMPDHYVLTKSGLDYLNEQVNEEKEPTYKVTVNQYQVSHSPTQIGSGNVLNNIHSQSIGKLLDEAEVCSAKSISSHDLKSKITSTILNIRNYLTKLNIKEIKNGLWKLYELLRSITSCIILATKIPELLSQLPT
jgi:hypothetical protein